MPGPVGCSKVASHPLASRYVRHCRYQSSQCESEPRNLGGSETSLELRCLLLSDRTFVSDLKTFIIASCCESAVVGVVASVACSACSCSRSFCLNAKSSGRSGRGCRRCGPGVSIGRRGSGDTARFICAYSDFLLSKVKMRDAISCSC